MPPPKVEEDDLSDLDDVLDEFTAAPAPAAAAAPVPAATAAPTASADDDDDFPDPDEDELLEADEEAMMKELEEGLKALYSAVPGAAGTDGGPGDDEMKKLLQEIMKSGDVSIGGQGTDAAKPSAKGKERAAGGAGQAGGDADFQSSIAATLAKLRSSSANADDASQSAAEGGDFAAMLAALAGGEGGLPGLEGGEEGLQKMLDEMMAGLMSREVLYDPLKELASKYPAYLDEHRASLTPQDLARYESQNKIVQQIILEFEKPGADAEDEPEESKSKRNKKVTELVTKMNDFGAPPTELLGDIPPELGMGQDGMPTDCVVC